MAFPRSISSIMPDSPSVRRTARVRCTRRIIPSSHQRRSSHDRPNSPFGDGGEMREVWAPGEGAKPKVRARWVGVVSSEADSGLYPSV